MSDDALSPIPPPVVQNVHAAGLRGPKGLSPRTNYSRVNTGAPPEPGAEISDTNPIQTGAPMKTASDTTAAARPASLQDMVKSAMSTALSKVQQTKIAEEARVALTAPAEETKTASIKTASVSTDYCTKLAQALSHMGLEMEKEAAHLGGSYNLTEHHQEPGKGPGALHVMEATDGKSVGRQNTGVAASTPAVNPPQEKHLPAERGSNVMASNLHENIGGGGTQQSSLPANKGKLASAPISTIRKVASQKKVAEDAINPAKISAGAAAPPSGTDATQSAGSFPDNASLVSSNQGAINYTKGQAKAPSKADLASVLDEKPMKDGEVLRAAFSSTDKAGTKFAGVEGGMDHATKVAAARNLLSRLAAGQKG